MPFCCNCGQPTKDTDRYCGSCGTRQAVAAAGPSAGSGLHPRTASILCYIPIFGWIPAIVVLASQKFRNDRTVRFHAFQGIYLFVAWLIVDWVIGPLYDFPVFGPHRGGMFHGFSFVGGILKAVIFATWIFMLIKTSQEQVYKLPVLGELAERSVAEQR
jgi:uncharacterized membrane protein